jgi:hypothetical protein
MKIEYFDAFLSSQIRNDMWITMYVYRVFSKLRCSF